MRYKFGHQVAPLALVRNLSTRFCHFDPLDFIIYSGRVTHTDNQNNAGTAPEQQEQHRNNPRNNTWNKHWKTPRHPHVDLYKMMQKAKCLLSFEERFRFVSLKLSIYKFTKVVDIKYSDLRDLLFSGCCLNYKVCLSPQQKWTSNIKEYKAFISERLVVLKVFLNLSILYKRMQALCPDLFQISEKDICATLQI